MPLPVNLIKGVIRYCNQHLVPDPEFDFKRQYHSEWFQDYFSFLGTPKEIEHLGDAFYQARFVYELMKALNLPMAKQKGIVKFQIVQYASICEAVMDIAITRFFIEEAEEVFSSFVYVPCKEALAKGTTMAYNATPLTLCRQKKEKGVLKRTRIDFKTKFACERGIISHETKARFDQLYNLRNNVHILKAADADYIPKQIEAKDAFYFMQDFISEIKKFYSDRV